MPIKFRCRHCRQFLGISRSQAGEITNCPQCGKAIRIPNLDGSVTPIPPPKLNLEDSELTNALHELATLEADDRLPEKIQEPSSPHIIATLSDCSAAPQARAIEQPATVIAKPVASAQPQPNADDTANESASAQGTHDVLAGLAAAVTREPATTNASADDSRLLRIGVPVACALVLIIAVDWLVRGKGGSEQASTATSEDARKADVNAPPAELATTSTDEPTLTGRITYVSESGETVPDSAAIVMLLPRPRAGKSKLDVTGFHPGTDTIDAQVATAALRALGGDVTSADEEGRYQLTVTDSGDYHVLVISHHQARSDNGPMETQLQELLSDYFYRPSTLLGRLAFHSEDFHYGGQGTSALDFAFPSD